MPHRLAPRDNDSYLSPRVVVARLESEFAYVEASEDEGRRHVHGLVRQLQKMMQLGTIPVNHEHLERLRNVRQNAIYVYFGDDPGSEIAYLSTAVIPGEALFFNYTSESHQRAARSLLMRCAGVLGYEVVEA